MSAIQGAGTTQRVVWSAGLANDAQAAIAASAPVLPPDGGLYGMGLEHIAAALASKSAEATIKVAREVQRAEKLQQAAEQQKQADAMHAKAGATLLQAGVSAGCSVGGGMLSLGSAASLTSRNAETATSKALGALGSTTSALSQPMGTFFGGARAIDLEADSSTHAAHAKTAEGLVDEFATLERQARSIVEKASSLMQSLVQERQAITRSILRAG